MRKYREQIYDLGNYKQINIYPVFKKAGDRRKRFQPTSEVQAALNRKNSAEHLERLITLNFTGKDRWVHLTYDEENNPGSVDEAYRDIANYIRRIKRKYDKAGILFKYIIVPEKGEKSGRKHFHVFMTGGIGKEVIEDSWGFGIARADRIKFGKKGVLPLAKYCTKQKLMRKRYICSKNLAKPEPRERDGKISGRQLRFWAEFKDFTYGGVLEKLYPGYELCFEPEISENQVNGGMYTTINLIRKEYLAEIESGYRKRRAK